MNLRTLIWLAGALLLAGCASNHPPLPETMSVLQPGDRLNVVVADHPELSAEGVIDPNGKFPLPYLGRFDASGMATWELEEAIEEALVQQGLLLAPSVTVMFTGGIYMWRGQ
jgi:protein involved in polysaccharide export with SLBB domain